MFPRILIAALVLYCLALIGTMLAPKAAAPFASPTTAVAHTSSPTQLPDPLIGFAINFHHTTDLSLYLKAVDEIAALGFNSLEVVTPAFQNDGASQSIRIEHGPGLSPSREDLVELLLYARSKGMSTTLMPIVLFSKPRGNEWRGKITPEQWGPWWDSYTAMTNYFVSIAIESDVQLFCIGSELLSTETNYDQWDRLIKRVRSRYKGKLIYSTNWDHYNIPTFWSQVDYIGVNGYWDMTTLSPSDNPSDPDSMARRWIEIRKRLLTFSDAQKRPVIMTEIGYPTLPWALQSPWNYVAPGPKTKVAPQAQAAGYRAFLAAWEDLLPSPLKRIAPKLDAIESVDVENIQNQNVQDQGMQNQNMQNQDAQPTTQASAPEILDDVASASVSSSTAVPTSHTPTAVSTSQALAPPVSQPLTQPLWPQEPTKTLPAPTRRHGFMGFYFYAWDVYHKGGQGDTGYGIRNKPSYKVVEQFMHLHGFEPVSPLDSQAESP